MKNIPARKKKILFLIPQSERFASGKVRVLNYIPYLRGSNIDFKIYYYHSKVVFLLRQMPKKGTIIRIILESLNKLHNYLIFKKLIILGKKYNALFIQWVMPREKFIAKFKVKNPNVKIIFDFDDAVYLCNPKRFDFIVRQSDYVCVDNSFLFLRAGRINQNTYIIPSAVPLEKFDAYQVHMANLSTTSGITNLNKGLKMKIVIGWIGSPSTQHYLYVLVDPFVELVKKYPNLVFFIAGVSKDHRLIPPFDNLSLKIIHEYNEEEMIRILHSFDIGVMPLYANEDAHARGSFKILNYMAARLPVVCSAIGENNFIITHGQNGYLARTTNDWVRFLSELIESHEKRRSIGNAGYQTVKTKYRTTVIYKKLYNTVLSKV